MELGFVGCNLNPDPAGGYWTDKPLTDRNWYPLYEKMVELDVPAMIHVSSSCNPVFHHVGAHYLNGDTTAFMQLLQSPRSSRIFRRCASSSRTAAARCRITGDATAVSRRTWAISRSTRACCKNVYFDTCVYHQAGIDLLDEGDPQQNIIFGSEMIGAVKGIDPETGHHFDDTGRYLAATPHLCDCDRQQVFAGNALKLYPRLKDRIAA